MIRARRRQHFYVFMLLLPLLPLLLAVVLIGRPATPPTQAELNPTLAASAGFSATTTGPAQMIDTGKHRLLVQRQLAHSAADTVLTIQPTSVILYPDLLIYWTPQAVAVEQPGNDAVLVGSLSGVSRRLLQLPAVAGNNNTDSLHGSLVLFSLAHGRVIDQFALSELHPPAQLTHSEAGE